MNYRTGTLFMALFLALSGTARAEEKFSFSFKEAPIDKVAQRVSEITKKRFVFSDAVRGMINIIIPDKLTVTQVYNAFSLALSELGYAISQQGDFYKIMSSRHVQRDSLEVVREVPSQLEPQRMITWITQLKYASAEKVFKELRILQSKDGETVVQADTNTLIFTDWISNLSRMSKILAQVDQRPEVAATGEKAKKRAN